MDVRYPDVEVALLGQDGNALMIVGAVRRALRSAGVSASEIEEFANEALSGDYNHVLTTVLEWVEVS